MLADCLPQIKSKLLAQKGEGVEEGERGDPPRRQIQSCSPVAQGDPPCHDQPRLVLNRTKPAAYDPRD